MSKRTGRWEDNPRDYVPSPYEVVPPLLPHLDPGTRFIEPCAGDGRLIGYLQEHGHICEAAFDIQPLDPCILPFDARGLRSTLHYEAREFITNPPWRRDVLHELIMRLSGMHGTWLLFDADWMHTKQAEPYLERCRKVVSVGRIKWVEGSKSTGYDNCAWYRFTAVHSRSGPTFHGQQTT